MKFTDKEMKALGALNMGNNAIVARFHVKEDLSDKQRRFLNEAREENPFIVTYNRYSEVSDMFFVKRFHFEDGKCEKNNHSVFECKKTGDAHYEVYVFNEFADILKSTDYTVTFKKNWKCGLVLDFTSFDALISGLKTLVTLYNKEIDGISVKRSTKKAI